MKSIYFYKTTSGKEIVLNFIENLDDLSKARIRNAIRLLERHGLDLMKDRSVKKVSRNPDVYELRIVSETQIRILFTVYDKQTYLVVHIFVKKTQKTPVKDLKLAIKRIKEFV